ncbi:hypothetical protein GF312_14260 [Candidatus Poribacteria bacterium]|nr:hypothetical protein [Candidatus Poribacteria bacterium]
MKEKDQKKNSTEKTNRITHAEIIKLHLHAFVLMHKGISVWRIIAAYLFLLFAILSFVFTIKIPVSNQFLTPTDAAKTQSRGITIFMTVVNLIVYGVILNWNKRSGFRAAIRIALIGVAFYLDMFLVQVLYVMIREGHFL